LPKKLGIEEGSTVAVLAPLPHFAGLVAPLPAGARLLLDHDGDGPCDVVVAFVTSHAELVNRFARGRDLLDPFGGLWIAWPKQSSPLATDLKEGHVRDHGLSTGLVDNKVCAIDGDWSGLRFVVRKENRPPGTRS
jgi:hypothetical protein